MNIVECYRLLELPANANLHEVKTSYRRLARQWHPDVNPDNHQAHEMFIQVTQAYKALVKILPPLPKPSVQPPPPQSQPTHFATPPVEPPSPQVNRSPNPQPQPKTPVPHPDGPWVKPPSPKVKVSVGRPQPPCPPVNSQHQPDPNMTQNTGSKKNAANATRPASNQRSPQPTSLANQKLKYDSYRQLQTLIKHKRFPRAVALVEALRQRLPQDLEIRQWQAIIYQSWGRQLIRERRVEQARAYLKKALNTDPHNRSLWAEVERDFQALEKVY